MLAAGAGSRLKLGANGEDLPKPLARLADKPLLEWVIERLLVIEPRRIIVVLGYRHHRIERLLRELDLGVEITLVINPAPERENGYSLLQAEGLVGERFLVAMADHLVDPASYRAAARHRGLGLCVDFAPRRWMIEEATKVLVEEGKIIEIGKSLEEWNGLDIGVFTLTPVAFKALHRLEGQKKLTLTEMVLELSRMGQVLEAIDFSGRPWIDIDTDEDLERGRRLILTEFCSSPSAYPRL